MARPFTPRIARLVACPEMWHHYVFDRAINTTGLSPAGSQNCRLLHLGGTLITPRAAVWYDPSTGWKGDGCDGHARAFHAGHPLTGSSARPLLEWTLGAQETCRRLVAEAVRAATVPDRR